MLEEEHSPLVPCGLWKDILPARMSPVWQLEVWWVSVHVFVLGMRVPTIYKLIHPPAVIQCSDSAYWLTDWRKPVILNSGEEAKGEQTYLLPLPNPLVVKHCSGSEQPHLFWRNDLNLDYISPIFVLVVTISSFDRSDKIHIPKRPKGVG